ncbi:type IV secretory system conjugative DNA transfer family protein [Vibrio harveyi]|nr:type IV secretory system conjugative DNA transfer family protein [Vibrio harveyi]
MPAPTRSGKGVGIVIPNCVTYPDSLVCVDIKFENLVKSGGFRQQCSKRFSCLRQMGMPLMSKRESAKSFAPTNGILTTTFAEVPCFE